jgi:hypothetical protein
LKSGRYELQHRRIAFPFIPCPGWVNRDSFDMSDTSAFH